MVEERVYEAQVWAQTVKKHYNYACAQCGLDEDVQSVHIRPPSMGGRNTLENGIALCLQCRTRRVLPSAHVRFNFSVPEALCHWLDDYCQASGRARNDVVKQLVADFAFDPDSGKNGFRRDGERNTSRISAPILSVVYGEFSKKCRELGITPGDAVKSLIYRYLETFGRDIK